MKKLLIIIAFSLPFIDIQAQHIYEINEVVVEGKAESDALELMKESGTSTTIISSKDLNNLGHNTAGDVIKRLPRIVVQGPPSFYRNIMMAGLDKEFQCVLINGNRPGGGEDSRDFKLDRLPVSMIESIEIINNPPASMGADATIGAVNITLKETPGKLSYGADLAIDRSSTFERLNPRGSFYFGETRGKWSLFLNGALNSFSRNNTASLTDTDIGGTESENLDVLIGGFNTNLSYEPDSLQKLSYQGAFTRYHEHLIFNADVKRSSSGGLKARQDSADDNKNRILHSHTLGYSRLYQNAFWDTRLSFAEHFDIKNKWRLREKGSGFEVSLDDEHQKNRDLNFRSDIEYDHALGGIQNKLKAGVRASALLRDFDRLVFSKIEDHMFWDNIEDGSYILNEYRGGAYLATEISKNRLWIFPAVRLDYDLFEYSTSSEESDQNSYLSFNPSLHARYNLGKDYFIKADLARQIARPPFNLMVPVEKVKSKKSVIERGNPDLLPSKALNTGLGLEKYFADRGFLFLRGFYSVLRDVVETRDAGIDDVYGYRILQSVNVDSGKVWGVDLNLKYRIMELGAQDLSVNGNVSWLGSEVRDTETMQIRRLSEQPEWIINGSFDYLNTRIGLLCSVGVNYVSERINPSSTEDGIASNDLVLAPFMQWDARIKYYYSTWGGVYINFLNIFDESLEYSQGTVSEVHTIGRNFILGLSVNF